VVVSNSSSGCQSTASGPRDEQPPEEIRQSAKGFTPREDKTEIRDCGPINSGFITITYIHDGVVLTLNILPNLPSIIKISSACLLHKFQDEVHVPKKRGRCCA